MKVLVVDNYDSFTYNLVHIVEQLADEVLVLRNDEVDDAAVELSDAIIISPGPGLPKDAGKTCEIIWRFYDKKPILGVCLGMQAMGEVFGAKLKNLYRVYHGKQTPIEIIDTNENLFKGMPEIIKVGRYHSWVLDNKSIPECLYVTAIDEQGEPMAIAHKEYNLKGVQFHPESIMTPQGKQMLRNWMEFL